MIPAMIVGPWMVALMLGWAPPSQPRQPAGERITAPPPEGGRPSGDTPPPAPRLTEAPELGRGSRAGDLGLDRLPDGSYRYVDPHRRFTLTIAPDGRPYFADRWRRPSSANAQHGKVGRRPGARSFVGNPLGMAMQGPLEWLVRASGHDLNTSAKMAALRETEAFRTDLAIAWHRTQIKKRLGALPADLLAVWGDDSLSLARRREILFEHWDACEDRLVVDRGGVPAGAVLTVDRLRRDAGDQARQTIIDFIRRELDQPAEVFSDTELSRFNARRVSVSAFDPSVAPEPEPTAEKPSSDPSTADAKAQAHD